jgi:hypothetical protein
VFPVVAECDCPGFEPMHFVASPDEVYPGGEIQYQFSLASASYHFNFFMDFSQIEIVIYDPYREFVGYTGTCNLGESLGDNTGICADFNDGGFELKGKIASNTPVGSSIVSEILCEVVPNLKLTFVVLGFSRNKL